MYYVIVEHLEECISPWMLSEYRFLSRIFEGRVVFTNVRNIKDREKLEGLGVVYSEDFLEIIKKLRLKKVVILDPQAEKQLRHHELREVDAVVIGGIMGDHPPKGRTYQLITSRAKNLESRNLGKKQFTIAGTAYVLKEIEGGKELEELDIREGLRLERRVNNIEVTVELPYVFPYKDGRPVIPPDYLETILYKSLLFEENPCKD
jgi:ribosome biogenesis SPOUT family RNA methylase Rps3